MAELVPGEQFIGTDERNAIQYQGLVPGEQLIGTDERNAIQYQGLVPGEQLIGTDERNAINYHEQASPKCVLCQYVMVQLENYLEDPTTEHDIEKFVENLCDKYLPKEMASQCEEFVTEYGEQLIEFGLNKRSSPQR